MALLHQIQTCINIFGILYTMLVRLDKTAAMENIASFETH